MAGETAGERLARLEEKLAALDRRVDDGFANRDAALVLQSKEYERRLQDLNNEAARIAAAADRSVNVDVYIANRAADAATLVAHVENDRVAHALIDRRFSEMTGATTGRADLVRWVFAAGAFVAAVFGIVAYATR